MPLLFCCNPGRTISQQGVRILMPRFRQPPLGLWVEDEMLEYDQAVVQDAQQTQAELHGVTCDERGVFQHDRLQSQLEKAEHTAS